MRSLPRVMPGPYVVRRPTRSTLDSPVSNFRFDTYHVTNYMQYTNSVFTKKTTPKIVRTLIHAREQCIMGRPLAATPSHSDPRYNAFPMYGVVNINWSSLVFAFIVYHVFCLCPRKLYRHLIGRLCRCGMRCAALQARMVPINETSRIPQTTNPVTA